MASKLLEKEILKKIKELEAQKSKLVKYLSIWIFDQNKEVDNPMVQNDYIKELRNKMQEVRSINYQLYALKDIIQTNN